jgi:hypothetical protein
VVNNLAQMKKINVNKSDEIAVIVEEIIEIDDKEIVLNIPRFSHIGESLSNFHLLKREADALDKKIIIESVDDHVVELAEMSGLFALNPFFTKNKRKFSDIVVAKTRTKKIALESELAMPADKQAMPEYAEETLEKRKFIKFPKLSWRLFKGIGLIFVLALVIFGAVRILPQAKVTIMLQTKEWIYNDSINTAKSAVLDAAKMSIPNQVFSQQKNVQLKFPATGKKQVKKSATGIITVYNSYSSDPQPLVIQTRFMAPDGKVFRLIKNITVPGAKINEGKIIPSSIDTEVVAEAAGPEYNIGPVKLFTIPGFKGTPKYQAFYGESKGNMAGGFIGEITYPTSDDIKEAKAKIKETLKQALDVAASTQIAKEFKILDDAKDFRVTEQKIDEEADNQGQFGIFAEAKLTAIAFKTEDLEALLTKRARQENGEDYDIRSFNLEYGLARADFVKGILTFPVKYKATLVKHTDINDLKSKILGKSENELKLTIFALPGLKSATVSLWPFWVKKVPNSVEKIKIIVQ